MVIMHRLKDGTRVDDITGHVVKMSDAKPVYDLLDKIMRENAKRRNNNHDQ